MKMARRSTRRTVARLAGGALLAPALLLGLDAAPVAAQSRLYVHAFEQASGALVTDLDRAEVIVREDGIVRPVVDVRLANLPARVVILVDNSRRARRGLDRVQEGLQYFVDRLPPYQEVSIVTLSPNPRWLVQGEIEPVPIREGIERLGVGGRSLRLLDGLVMAGEWLAEDSGPFRGVLVVISTAGVDRSRASTQRFTEMVEQARDAGMRAHTLLMQPLNPNVLRRGVTLPEAVGRDLETYTEGSYRRASLGSDLRDALGGIADRILERNRELARQHLVRYDRPPDAPSGTVHVTVTRFGVRYVVSTDGKSTH
ncbi:MAG: hypothetical protein F4W89_06480 [Acidobacteria bacterium]|nr:hypothetical protein [Acidobacteriota bacterium]